MNKAATETIAGEEGQQMKSSSARHLFPAIILAAWGVWLLYLLFQLVGDANWRRTQPNAAAYGYTYGLVFGGPIVVGIAGWLAWRIYQQPSRGATVWFIVLCVFLIWKFWIGYIFFYMHPSFGGHSFSGAVAQWWSRSTANLGLALASLLPPLLLISGSYWPVYCRKRKLDRVTIPLSENRS